MGELVRGSHESGNHETMEDPDSEDWREWVEAAATFFRAGAPEEPVAEDTESVDCESLVTQSSSAEVAESESSSSSSSG